jgi:ATP-dependent RNA helicase DDX52/ROK1
MLSILGKGSTFQKGKRVINRADAVEKAAPAAIRIQRRDEVADRMQRVTDVSPAMSSFSELAERFHAPWLLSVLQSPDFAHWVTPTPVQTVVMPPLYDRFDCVVSAPTGGGKTAAFLIPVLARLSGSLSLPAVASSSRTARSQRRVRAIFLAPTRELAQQTHTVLSQLLGPRPGVAVPDLRSLLLVQQPRKVKGRVSADEDKIAAAFDLVVATPMTLLHAAEHRGLDVGATEFFVIDEADRVLHAGHSTAANAQLAQVMKLIDMLPTSIERVVATPSADGDGSQREKIHAVRALFSATITQEVQEVARSFMAEPLHLTVGASSSSSLPEGSGATVPTAVAGATGTASELTVSQNVRQRLVYVGESEEGKLVELRNMRAAGLRPPVLIFVQSKKRVDDVAGWLSAEPVFGVVDRLHSSLTKTQREAALTNLRLGRSFVLVTTDVAARGLDIQGVSCVINLDVPMSIQDYVHRVGRAGRQFSGEAVTFFTDRDLRDVKPIAKLALRSGLAKPEDVPAIALSSNESKGRHRSRLHAAKDRAPRRTHLIAGGGGIARGAGAAKTAKNKKAAVGKKAASE